MCQSIKKGYWSNQEAARKNGSKWPLLSEAVDRTYYSNLMLTGTNISTTCLHSCTNVIKMRGGVLEMLDCESIWRPTSEARRISDVMTKTKFHRIIYVFNAAKISSWPTLITAETSGVRSVWNCERKALSLDVSNCDMEWPPRCYIWNH